LDHLGGVLADIHHFRELVNKTEADASVVHWHGNAMNALLVNSYTTAVGSDRRDH